MRVARLSTAVIAGFLTAALPAAAQQAPITPGRTAAAQASVDATKPNIVFNHLKDTAKIFDLDLEDGETFIVRIQSTCPDAFDYPYVGLARGQVELQGEEKKPLSDHDITVVYDDRYGGYVFSINPKAGVSAAEKCLDGDQLKPGTFIVSVREQTWGMSFSGGFTFSGLTSPVFGLRTESGVKKVIRETDKEDARKLGAASFVHVYHDALQWKDIRPALAFGLGINGDNRSEYFAGGGLRLGDKAAINGGVAFGSISRLPNGVTFETPVTDDNLLSNLGSRVVRRWFFALSFSFVDTQDRLKKPFATEAPVAAPAPAAGQASTAPSPNQKIVEALAQDAGTYSGLMEMKSVAICRAEVKAAAANTFAVTLHLKDPAQLPALQAPAVTRSVTDALNASIKTNIPAMPPTVTVTFGQACQ